MLAFKVKHAKWKWIFVVFDLIRNEKYESFRKIEFTLISLIIFYASFAKGIP